MHAELAFDQDRYNHIGDVLVPDLSTRQQYLGSWSDYISVPQDIVFGDYSGSGLLPSAEYLWVTGHDQNGYSLDQMVDTLATVLQPGNYRASVNAQGVVMDNFNGDYTTISSQPFQIGREQTVWFMDQWLSVLFHDVSHSNTYETLLEPFTLSLVGAGINTTAGLSADNPLFPISYNNGNWEFNIGDQSIEWIAGRGASRGAFFDPEVATGYTYEAGNDVAFSGVTISSIFGDGIYSLWLWDDTTSSYVDSYQNLNAGEWFDFLAAFGGDGLMKFQVRGISTEYLVDPNNPEAFVTGLTFLGSGDQFTMTAMTTYVAPLTPSVPVPPALWLFISGLLGLTGVASRKAACSI